MRLDNYSIFLGETTYICLVLTIDLKYCHCGMYLIDFLFLVAIQKDQQLSFVQNITITLDYIC